MEDKSYVEAYRYIANAEDLLRQKAVRENGFYKDSKYVRMAGNTAWNGVLIAVEHWLHNKEVQLPKDVRPSFNWYVKELSKRHRTLNKHFEVAYKILHKYMGYDGIEKVSTVEDGLEEARIIIAICDTGKA